MGQSVVLFLCSYGRTSCDSVSFLGVFWLLLWGVGVMFLGAGVVVLFLRHGRLWSFLCRILVLRREVAGGLNRRYMRLRARVILSCQRAVGK